MSSLASMSPPLGLPVGFCYFVEGFCWLAAFALDI